MFSQVSVCPRGAGGRAWQGVCVAGGMHGRGACMAGGACVVGGMHGGGGKHGERGHVWQGILQDTVNEQVVCILLKCILLLHIFSAC